MRIGLVIPASNFLIDDRCFIYLGVIQLGTFARTLGHEVEVVDLTGHPRVCTKSHHDDACAESTLSEAKRRVADLAARSDVVGCYSMAALHFFVSRLLPAIREGNPSCVAVLGGPHASTAPERCAAEGWDYVVVSDQGGGGGEPGFAEVLKRVGRRSEAPRLGRLPMLTNSAGIGACESVSLMTRSGPVVLGPDAANAIIRVPSRDPGAGLYQNDRFPWPDRSLVDFESYRYTIGEHRFASFVDQAGCVFRCSFCAHSEGYTKMALRSPAHVEAEIRAVLARYPYINAFMNYADEINIRTDFDEMLGTYKKLHREMGIVWRGFFKSGRRWMTDDLFARMADAGIRYLCTGAESAHPAVLKLVGKGATVEDNTAFVRLCVKHGIKPKVFTMVGLPAESPESVEALATWLEAMAADGLSDADTTICTPTSGTPLFEESEKWLKTGLISFDKAELVSNNESVNYKGAVGQYKSFVSTPTLSRAALVRARAMVERRFRKAAGLAPLGVSGKDDG